MQNVPATTIVSLLLVTAAIFGLILGLALAPHVADPSPGADATLDQFFNASRLVASDNDENDTLSRSRRSSSTTNNKAAVNSQVTGDVNIGMFSNLIHELTLTFNGKQKRVLETNHKELVNHKDSGALLNHAVHHLMQPTGNSEEARAASSAASRIVSSHIAMMFEMHSNHLRVQYSINIVVVSILCLVGITALAYFGVYFYFSFSVSGLTATKRKEAKAQGILYRRATQAPEKKVQSEELREAHKAEQTQLIREGMGFPAPPAEVSVTVAATAPPPQQGPYPLLPTPK